MQFSAIKLIGFTRRKFAEEKISLNGINYDVEGILHENFPFYSCLSSVHKKEFTQKVLVFLNSKKFIGMNGFRINLTHKTIVASLAVRIVFRLGLKFYDHIINICLFETEFPGSNNTKLEGITQSNGIIALAWNAIEEGIKNSADGRNVVFHEFAHALDLYDFNFDGIPGIFKPCVIKPLISGIINEHEKFLDEWKEWHRFTYKFEVKDIAEFFAKLTELYFENPVLLKKHDHNLYQILLNIYKYEPDPIRLLSY
jgi:hypothetical protein